ncbi:MAG TPA: hypothetical protein GXX40_02555 [Firmicutes bacterium]|nr:hypothetical protein [Bacillota bacterium]
MKFLTMPVVNAALPYYNGGNVVGIFLDEKTAATVQATGTGGLVLILPYVVEKAQLYRVGVLARVEALWIDRVFVNGPGNLSYALFAKFSGRGRYTATSIGMHEGLLVAEAKPLDLDWYRARGYPSIDGSGWQAIGGDTELKGLDDLPVRLYGMELDKGREVEICGNLGGLVSPESAHTIEHAIIRSLHKYAVCTPRTLAECIREEGRELRASLDAGFRYRRPEIFGVTSSGACGNPLTNLAQIYLMEELAHNLKKGERFEDGLEDARLKTLSRVTADLEISTSPLLRIGQALKRGMAHEDTPLSQADLKRIVACFPPGPWG